MKKKAFTLAEVLITLGIIGVVAAVTVPTLITNYQNKQHLVRFQKSYSTLSQAAKLYPATMGCDTMTCTGLLARQTYGDGQRDEVVQKYMNQLKDFVNFTFKVAKSCSYEKDDCIDNPNRSSMNLKDEFKTELSAGKFNCESSSNTAIDQACIIFQTMDGAIYKMSSWSGGLGPNYFYIDNYQIMVDTNGDAGPNRFGYDVFNFILTKDRGLIPEGSSAMEQVLNRSYSDWKEDPLLCGLPNQSVPTVNVGWSDLQGENANEAFITLLTERVSGEGCGARIIDEGYKMTYIK